MIVTHALHMQAGALATHALHMHVLVHVVYPQQHEVACWHTISHSTGAGVPVFLPKEGEGAISPLLRPPDTDRLSKQLITNCNRHFPIPIYLHANIYTKQGACSHGYIASSLIHRSLVKTTHLPQPPVPRTFSHCT